jgi:hypothetical protein
MCLPGWVCRCICFEEVFVLGVEGVVRRMRESSRNVSDMDRQRSCLLENKPLCWQIERWRGG